MASTRKRIKMFVENCLLASSEGDDCDKDSANANRNLTQTSIWRSIGQRGFQCEENEEYHKIRA